MAYIRLPAGIRIALEFDLGGKPVVNIYHVTTTDPITTIKLQEIAQVFLTWWVTTQLTNFSDYLSVTGVTALNLDEPNGEKVEIPQTPPVFGTVAGGAAPNNVAYVVSLKTAQTGRSFQGRTFLAGLGDQEIDGNNVSVARAALITTAFVTLDIMLAVENADLVVASFQTLGVPRALGVATKIDSYTANTRVDTQRRRMPRN